MRRPQHSEPLRSLWLSVRWSRPRIPKRRVVHETVRGLAGRSERHI